MSQLAVRQAGGPSQLVLVQQLCSNSCQAADGFETEFVAMLGMPRLALDPLNRDNARVCHYALSSLRSSKQQIHLQFGNLFQPEALGKPANCIGLGTAVSAR